MLWLSGLLACLALGIIFGLRSSPGGSLPRHAGYYIAGASLLAGLAFGLRAALWPVVGSFAFGLARLSVSVRTGNHDQRVDLILYFTYFPLLLMIPALVGGVIHWGTRRAMIRRPLSKHAD
jgi:cell division protein FtsX